MHENQRAAPPLSDQEANKLVNRAPQQAWFRELNRRVGSDPARLMATARILEQLL